MKKIISLVLLLAMVLGCVAVLSSCGKKEENCTHPKMTYTKKDATNHTASCPDCGYTPTQKHTWKGDACSLCGAKKTVATDPCDDEINAKDYPWGSTNLVMSVGDNSNRGELESGGKAFVSGEWTEANVNAGNTMATVDADILRQVVTRNANAANATHVTMTYQYMVDYGWNQVMSQIAVETAADNTPDIYYNFIYDMVGASINGYFANVYGNTYLGPFYENFDKDAIDAHGYNWQYMQDLTFSTKVMYLIASDFSFDLSRAYMIMPISLKLLDQAINITGDWDGNTIVDVDDFYAMVKAGGWTWSKIMEYTEALRKPDSNGGYSLAADGNCIAGFAMSSQSGLATTAAMYTSSMHIVNREVGADGEYTYSYGAECPASLVAICNMLKDVVAGTDGERDQLTEPKGTSGVLIYKGQTTETQQMFAQNRLFCDTAVLLGAIEKSIYQTMWDDSTGSKGFAVAPVAKLTTDGNYQTTIHNVGKVFGISSKCGSVDAACAYINYNSTESSDILAEYYEWVIGYGRAVTTANVELLLNMKEDLVYSHDKVVEDAIGIIYNTETITNPLGGEDTTVGAVRWHIFALSYWKCDQISQLYTGVKDMKLSKLQEIQQNFIKNAKLDG